MEKVAPTISKPTMSPAAQPVISTQASNNVIQRDFTVQPINPAPPPPKLSPGQVREAINYNNDRYNKENILTIQEIVGGPKTGVMVAETIDLIALYQLQNGQQKIDGKVGVDTFKLLTTELATAQASTTTVLPEKCLTMFNVETTMPMEIHAAGPGLVNVFGHFEVDISFSPHCDCSRFEYRQFICGTVTHNGNNINANFAIPGGGLPAIGAWREDGNTNFANNGRYGYRNHAANQGIRNQYLDDQGQIDMANGCRFKSIDEPGVVGGPGAAGDVYVFDFRFFGDIMKDGTKVDRKFWAIRETVTIP